ncbi:50S ribosomal protein L29 [Wolbachia endosymbiont of Diaphorina citri]|jgi:ribosomal protein L29|uniref:50S ribosomal protein L29 n=1 Tax=unclassified Wolbachia TaxID=2640676 RepID=UPI0003045D30|nr:MULTISPECIES: 50S ribosomal protein L29 [unclassified Wolbachia]OAB81606.1 50S ribosomal protein L29 [Wolbachia endosymbiont of Laodelphax striatellus]QJT94159.1 50S ribosomal protein L29 [Wolbachia endosymbiont of Diaphorina citri]QJT95400.1 50S ribosomal protein L29 [Wolbachia endosymbiont of Diaphorina citri]QJT96761.1 50S ribosomal protein L29 [Wolbachia endosymbiont of Diaphorina citri]QLK12053.1 50S ribosomal protein L29 [Wolbachia endosymbiont of Diaphorina citri]
MDIVKFESESSQGLHQLLVNLRKEFVNLSFQKKLGQCNNFSRFSLIRKSIARSLTVLNRRKREGKNA